jgi:hypothetical protein
MTIDIPEVEQSVDELVLGNFPVHTLLSRFNQLIWPRLM